MDDKDIPGLGTVHLKQEGAPVHPDDVDWEHPNGSGCAKCQEKYDRQLKAYLDYYGED